MFSFDVRRNRKTQNGVKCNALQNGFLGLLIFFDFDPKNSKLYFFSKIVAFKSQNLPFIKNVLYVIEKDTNNRHITSQSNISDFDCATAKKNS